jgi:hypothetical protein
MATKGGFDPKLARALSQAALEGFQGRPEPSRLRSLDEIQRAHDQLAAIVLGEVPNPVAPEGMPLVISALDALCWALNHDHNRRFAEQMECIDKWLAERGFITVRKQ